MNRSRHPYLQLAAVAGIGLPVVAAGLFAIDRAFLTDPRSGELLAAEQRVYRDASTSIELLDELIARDEVTWDPTNGERIATVLASLKRTDGPALLLVGSSQLLVVRDDRTAAGIARRVDKVLDERLAGEVTVYNLSLGGMTLPEKRLMLDHALRRIDVDQIVVGLTLWDSASDEVRPALARLPVAPVPAPAPGFARALPSSINRAVTSRVERALGDAIPLLGHRSAIQRWLASELFPRATRGGDADRGGPLDAEPVSYAYDERQRR
ncbi:MAG TPA: hypothetical protein VD788_12145, partial [Candidatus Polarisedimenticolaceae bacterium]|nr:hypothetical protein [Candidatus Polarisedimenticolaceae bacterium]